MSERHISELGDLVEPAAPAYLRPCDISGYLVSELMDFLRQDHMVNSALPETLSQLEKLAARLDLVPAASEKPRK